MTRALNGGMTPADCFRLIGEFRKVDATTPIGLLVYANLVYSRGRDAFYDDCRRHDVDSVLVADVPLVEADPYCEAATAAGVAPVLLCPPNISDDRLQQLARRGRGYTYLLSRAGVTGTGVAAGRPARELLLKLKQFDAAPPLLGFGISRPEHVKAAISEGARGVICGSAIIERITATLGDLDSTITELRRFVSSMKAAA